MLSAFVVHSLPKSFYMGNASPCAYLSQLMLESANNTFFYKINQSNVFESKLWSAAILQLLEESFAVHYVGSNTQCEVPRFEFLLG